MDDSLLALFKKHNVRRDELAEMCLEQVGVAWEYREIDFSAIDYNESNRNRGRSVVLHHDVRERYAAGMLRGDTFPAFACREVGDDGKLIIAGGWHRYHGMLDIGNTSTVALVFRCTDLHFRLLCGGFNAVMGEAITTAERVDAAKKLVELDKYTVVDAAAWYRVSVTAVRDAYRADRIRHHIVSLGCANVRPSDIEKMPLKILTNLAKFENQPVVMKELVEYVKCARPTVEQMKAVTAAIAAKPTEEMKLTAIRSMKEAESPRNGKLRSARLPKKTAFIRWLTMAENLLAKAQTARQLQLDESDRELLLKRWRPLSKKVSRILSGSGM